MPDYVASQLTCIVVVVEYRYNNKWLSHWSVLLTLRFDMHLPAAVVTSAAVGRIRAARAVNLGAEGLGKPKWD
jgi:hypothetical protein